jgi:hypothetical protein
VSRIARAVSLPLAVSVSITREGKSRSRDGLAGFFNACRPTERLTDDSRGEALPDHRSADRDKVSSADMRELAGELRDTERAIKLWYQKASTVGHPPPWKAFDFSRMPGDWGYRFVIGSGALVETAEFVTYGGEFRRLFELPEKATNAVPMLQQLPERYRPLFSDGCSKAMAESAPVRFSGAVSHLGKIEIYRAAFMPVEVQPASSVQLVFGSFNRRALPRLVIVGPGRLAAEP